METQVTRSINFPYPVRINWDNQSVPWWNEMCAWALEHFGLPGDRFLYHPFEDYMEFHFKSKADQLMFVIAWGKDDGF